jgi:hypothetical protein
MTPPWAKRPDPAIRGIGWSLFYTVEFADALVLQEARVHVAAAKLPPAATICLKRGQQRQPLPQMRLQLARRWRLRQMSRMRRPRRRLDLGESPALFRSGLGPNARARRFVHCRRRLRNDRPANTRHGCWFCIRIHWHWAHEFKAAVPFLVSNHNSRR